MDTRRDFLRFAAGAAGGALLSGWTLRAPAAEDAVLACTHATPAVRVDTSLPDPVLDNSRPQRTIQALAPGYHDGRTIGLYYSEIEAKIRTKFRSLAPGRRSPACLFITAVDVGIVMPKRQIYVASELLPGTCPHTAVLQHERKHEATDDHAVRKHAPRIETAIQDAVAKLGPLEVSANEHAAVQARLDEVLRSAFDKAWQAFLAERSDLQRQVDAGLEYARVTASCPDWSPIQR
jgi:hypothetical protein